MVTKSLQTTDFTDPINAEIFDLLRSVYQEYKTTELAVVVQKAKDKGVSDRCGGLANIMKILSGSTLSDLFDQVGPAIDILREKTANREIFSLGSMVKELAEAVDSPTSSKIETIRQKLQDISTRNAKKNAFIGIGDVMKAEPKTPSGDGFLQEVIYNQDHPEAKSLGIPTGFVDLDKIVRINPGSMILIAARPGVGKTTFSLNIAEHMAFKCKIPLVYLSLEQTPQDIFKKILSSQLEIPYEDIINHRLKSEEFQEVIEFQEGLANNILVTHNPRWTIPELRLHMMRCVDSFGVKALFIDYLQLVKTISSQKKNSTKYTDITEISQDIKQLALELNIPIICVSQLSRDVEKRQDGKPQLSDLRDSGALEQDADVVIMLHRWDAKDKYDRPGRAMASVKKNRYGQLDDVELVHKFEISKFATFSPAIAPSYVPED